MREMTMRVIDVKGDAGVAGMESDETADKWRGNITAAIAAPLDRTWQIASDFSGLHKFVPIVEICERLKGRNRAPGCLRFYTLDSPSGLPGGKRKGWAKERLLEIEEETHSYTYVVEGSNMHLENCVVTFKASDGRDGTTVLDWSYELSPVKKSTREKTLSDMSEFGCTFIKGLEVAATTDAIDFDFEGMDAKSRGMSSDSDDTDELQDFDGFQRSGPKPMGAISALSSSSTSSSSSSFSSTQGHVKGSKRHNTHRRGRAPRRTPARSKQKIVQDRKLRKSKTRNTQSPESEDCQTRKSPRFPSRGPDRNLVYSAHDSLYAFQLEEPLQDETENDIAHQLESVESQLEAVGLQMQEMIVAGLKDGTFKTFQPCHDDYPCPCEDLLARNRKEIEIDVIQDQKIDESTRAGKIASLEQEAESKGSQDEKSKGPRTTTPPTSSVRDFKPRGSRADEANEIEKISLCEQPDEVSHLDNGDGDGNDLVMRKLDSIGRTLKLEAEEDTESPRSEETRVLDSFYRSPNHVGAPKVDPPSCESSAHECGPRDLFQQGQKLIDIRQSAGAPRDCENEGPGIRHNSRNLDRGSRRTRLSSAYQSLWPPNPAAEGRHTSHKPRTEENRHISQEFTAPKWTRSVQIQVPEDRSLSYGGRHSTTGRVSSVRRTGSCPGDMATKEYGSSLKESKLETQLTTSETFSSHSLFEGCSQADIDENCTRKQFSGKPLTLEIEPCNCNSNSVSEQVSQRPRNMKIGKCNCQLVQQEMCHSPLGVALGPCKCRDAQKVRNESKVNFKTRESGHGDCFSNRSGGMSRETEIGSGRSDHHISTDQFENDQHQRISPYELQDPVGAGQTLRLVSGSSDEVPQNRYNSNSAHESLPGLSAHHLQTPRPRGSSPGHEAEPDPWKTRHIPVSELHSSVPRAVEGYQIPPRPRPLSTHEGYGESGNTRGPPLRHSIEPDPWKYGHNSVNELHSHVPSALEVKGCRTLPSLWPPLTPQGLGASGSARSLTLGYGTEPDPWSSAAELQNELSATVKVTGVGTPHKVRPHRTREEFGQSGRMRRQTIDYHTEPNPWNYRENAGDGVQNPEPPAVAETAYQTLPSLRPHSISQGFEANATMRRRTPDHDAYADPKESLHHNHMHPAVEVTGCQTPHSPKVHPITEGFGVSGSMRHLLPAHHTGVDPWKIRHTSVDELQNHLAPIREVNDTQNLYSLRSPLQHDRFGRIGSKRHLPPSLVDTDPDPWQNHGQNGHISVDDLQNPEHPALEVNAYRSPHILRQYQARGGFGAIDKFALTSVIASQGVHETGTGSLERNGIGLASDPRHRTHTDIPRTDDIPVQWEGGANLLPEFGTVKSPSPYSETGMLIGNAESCEQSGFGAHPSCILPEFSRNVHQGSRLRRPVKHQTEQVCESNELQSWRGRVKDASYTLDGTLVEELEKNASEILESSKSPEACVDQSSKRLQTVYEKFRKIIAHSCVPRDRAPDTKYESSGDDHNVQIWQDILSTLADRGVATTGQRARNGTLQVSTEETPVKKSRHLEFSPTPGVDVLALDLGSDTNSCASDLGAVRNKHRGLAQSDLQSSQGFQMREQINNLREFETRQRKHRLNCRSRIKDEISKEFALLGLQSDPPSESRMLDSDTLERPDLPDSETHKNGGVRSEMKPDDISDEENSRRQLKKRAEPKSNGHKLMTDQSFPSTNLAAATSSAFPVARTLDDKQTGDLSHGESALARILNRRPGSSHSRKNPVHSRARTFHRQLQLAAGEGNSSQISTDKPPSPKPWLSKGETSDAGKPRRVTPSAREGSRRNNEDNVPSMQSTTAQGSRSGHTSRKTNLTHLRWGLGSFTTKPERDSSSTNSSHSLETSYNHQLVRNLNLVLEPSHSDQVFHPLDELEFRADTQKPTGFATEAESAVQHHPPAALVKECPRTPLPASDHNNPKIVLPKPQWPSKMPKSRRRQVHKFHFAEPMPPDLRAETVKNTPYHPPRRPTPWPALQTQSSVVIPSQDLADEGSRSLPFHKTRRPTPWPGPQEHSSRSSDNVQASMAHEDEGVSLQNIRTMKKAPQDSSALDDEHQTSQARDPTESTGTSRRAQTSQIQWATDQGQNSDRRGFRNRQKSQIWMASQALQQSEAGRPQSSPRNAVAQIFETFPTETGSIPPRSREASLQQIFDTIPQGPRGSEFFMPSQSEILGSRSRQNSIAQMERIASKQADDPQSSVKGGTLSLQTPLQRTRSGENSLQQILTNTPQGSRGSELFMPSQSQIVGSKSHQNSVAQMEMNAPKQFDSVGGANAKILRDKLLELQMREANVPHPSNITRVSKGHQNRKNRMSQTTSTSDLEASSSQENYRSSGIEIPQQYGRAKFRESWSARSQPKTTDYDFPQQSKDRQAGDDTSESSDTNVVSDLRFPQRSGGMEAGVHCALPAESARDTSLEDEFRSPQLGGGMEAEDYSSPGPQKFSHDPSLEYDFKFDEQGEDGMEAGGTSSIRPQTLARDTSSEEMDFKFRQRGEGNEGGQYTSAIRRTIAADTSLKSEFDFPHQDGSMESREENISGRPVTTFFDTRLETKIPQQSEGVEPIRYRTARNQKIAAHTSLGTDVSEPHLGTESRDHNSARSRTMVSDPILHHRDDQPEDLVGLEVSNVLNATFQNSLSEMLTHLSQKVLSLESRGPHLPRQNDIPPRFEPAALRTVQDCPAMPGARLVPSETLVNLNGSSPVPAHSHVAQQTEQGACRTEQSSVLLVLGSMPLMLDSMVSDMPQESGARRSTPHQNSVGQRGMGNQSEVVVSTIGEDPQGQKQVNRMRLEVDIKERQSSETPPEDEVRGVAKRTHRDTGTQEQDETIIVLSKEVAPKSSQASKHRGSHDIQDLKKNHAPSFQGQPLMQSENERNIFRLYPETKQLTDKGVQSEAVIAGDGHDAYTQMEQLVEVVGGRSRESSQGEMGDRMTEDFAHMESSGSHKSQSHLHEHSEALETSTHLLELSDHQELGVAMARAFNRKNLQIHTARSYEDKGEGSCRRSHRPRSQVLQDSEALEPITHPLDPSDHIEELQMTMAKEPQAIQSRNRNSLQIHMARSCGDNGESNRLRPHSSRSQTLPQSEVLEPSTIPLETSNHDEELQITMAKEPQAIISRNRKSLQIHMARSYEDNGESSCPQSRRPQSQKFHQSEGLEPGIPPLEHSDPDELQVTLPKATHVIRSRNRKSLQIHMARSYEVNGENSCPRSHGSESQTVLQSEALEPSTHPLEPSDHQELQITMAKEPQVMQSRNRKSLQIHMARSYEDKGDSESSCPRSHKPQPSILEQSEGPESLEPYDNQGLQITAAEDLQVIKSRNRKSLEIHMARSYGVNTESSCPHSQIPRTDIDSLAFLFEHMESSSLPNPHFPILREDSDPTRVHHSQNQERTSSALEPEEISFRSGQHRPSQVVSSSTEAMEVWTAKRSPSKIGNILVVRADDVDLRNQQNREAFEPTTGQLSQTRMQHSTDEQSEDWEPMSPTPSKTKKQRSMAKLPETTESRNLQHSHSQMAASPERMEPRSRHDFQIGWRRSISEQDADTSKLRNRQPSQTPPNTGTVARFEPIEHKNDQQELYSQVPPCSESKESRRSNNFQSETRSFMSEQSVVPHPKIEHNFESPSVPSSEAKESRSRQSFQSGIRKSVSAQSDDLKSMSRQPSQTTVGTKKETEPINRQSRIAKQSGMIESRGTQTSRSQSVLSSKSQIHQSSQTRVYIRDSSDDHDQAQLMDPTSRQSSQHQMPEQSDETDTTSLRNSRTYDTTKQSELTSRDREISLLQLHDSFPSQSIDSTNRRIPNETLITIQEDLGVLVPVTDRRRPLSWMHNASPQDWEVEDLELRRDQSSPTDSSHSEKGNFELLRSLDHWISSTIGKPPEFWKSHSGTYPDSFAMDGLSKNFEGRGLKTQRRISQIELLNEILEDLESRSDKEPDSSAMVDPSQNFENRGMETTRRISQIELLNEILEDLESRSDKEPDSSAMVHPSQNFENRGMETTRRISQIELLNEILEDLESRSDKEPDSSAMVDSSKTFENRGLEVQRKFSQIDLLNEILEDLESRSDNEPDLSTMVDSSKNFEDRGLEVQRKFSQIDLLNEILEDLESRSDNEPDMSTMVDSSKNFEDKGVKTPRKISQIEFLNEILEDLEGTVSSKPESSQQVMLPHEVEAMATGKFHNSVTRNLQQHVDSGRSHTEFPIVLESQDLGVRTVPDRHSERQDDMNSEQFAGEDLERKLGSQVLWHNQLDPELEGVQEVDAKKINYAPEQGEVVDEGDSPTREDRSDQLEPELELIDEGDSQMTDKMSHHLELELELIDEGDSQLTQKMTDQLEPELELIDEGDSQLTQKMSDQLDPELELIDEGNSQLTEKMSDQLEPELELIDEGNSQMPEKISDQLEPELELIDEGNTQMTDNTQDQLEPELGLIDKGNSQITDKMSNQLEPELELIGEGNYQNTDKMSDQLEPELELIEEGNRQNSDKMSDQLEPELEFIDEGNSQMTDKMSDQLEPELELIDEGNTQMTDNTQDQLDSELELRDEDYSQTRENTPDQLEPELELIDEGNSQLTEKMSDQLEPELELIDESNSQDNTQMTDNSPDQLDSELELRDEDSYQTRENTPDQLDSELDLRDEDYYQTRQNTSDQLDSELELRDEEFYQTRQNTPHQIYSELELRDEGYSHTRENTPDQLEPELELIDEGYSQTIDTQIQHEPELTDEGGSNKVDNRLDQRDSESEYLEEADYQFQSKLRPIDEDNSNYQPESEREVVYEDNYQPVENMPEQPEEAGHEMDSDGDTYETETLDGMPDQREQLESDVHQNRPSRLHDEMPHHIGARPKDFAKPEVSGEKNDRRSKRQNLKIAEDLTSGRTESRRYRNSQSEPYGSVERGKLCCEVETKWPDNQKKIFINLLTLAAEMIKVWPLPLGTDPTCASSWNFEYEFDAATANIPKVYDFESSELPPGASDLQRFDGTAPSTISTARNLGDINFLNPDRDELAQLEAEVFGLETT